MYEKQQLANVDLQSECKYELFASTVFLYEMIIQILVMLKKCSISTVNVSCKLSSFEQEHVCTSVHILLNVKDVV